MDETILDDLSFDIEVDELSTIEFIEVLECEGDTEND